MQKHAGIFDFILDTVSADHDINAYLNLLVTDGTLTLVGAPDKLMPVSALGLIFGRKRLAGSLIGGLAETQEISTSAARIKSPSMSRSSPSSRSTKPTNAC